MIRRAEAENAVAAKGDIVNGECTGVVPFEDSAVNPVEPSADVRR